MLQYVQKRHAAGVSAHPPNPHPFLAKPEDVAPVAPENVGRTGYGEIRGELRNIMGGPVEELNDFPPDMGKLERGRWYPYSLRDDFPPFITTSPEQNQRIWTEMAMEQLLDHHPPHEVHARYQSLHHIFASILRIIDVINIYLVNYQIIIIFHQ